MPSANSLVIRRLGPDEWEQVRAFRLLALKAAPGSFFVSHAETAEKPPSYWTNMLGDEEAALFGLFDGDCLVALTAAFVDRDDPSGGTAFLGMSFVLPSHRGRGLARRLFKARLDWARARGLRRAVVYSRASNLSSRGAIECQGFVLTDEVDHVWPDGERDKDLKYELALDVQVAVKPPFTPF